MINGHCEYTPETHLTNEKGLPDCNELCIVYIMSENETPARAHMESFHVSAPDKFDCADGKEWPKWIRRFQRYRVTSGLNKRDNEFQVNTLIYFMGDEAEDILNASTLTADEKLSYAAVENCFKDHFVGKHNIIFERAKFNMRKQEPGESADSFITAVHKLAEHCNFGPLKDELIRDRVVVGIRDLSLSEKLQMDSDLTLSKAVGQVKQNEMVKQQQANMRGSPSQTDEKSEMDAVSGPVKRKPTTYNSKQQAGYVTKQTENVPNMSKCSRCGKIPFHGWKECPAKDAECRNCHRRGHFAVVCRSRQQVQEVFEQQDIQEDSLYLGEVKDYNTGWYTDITLNGENISFKIDTGAAVTAIPTKLYDYRRDGPLMESKKKLYGPNNKRLLVAGQVMCKVESKDLSTSQTVFVIDSLSRPLLGLPAIEALQLVERIDAVELPEERFKNKFPKVFTGLGKLEGNYCIRLKADAVPYTLTTPRRVPIPLENKIKEELERMERMGVISRIEQPTEWCAGMVPVVKPNGQIRICVDLTKLNEAVCRERHILPSVEQSLAQLNGATIFTKLDAQSGFWQIPLVKECRELTTFITPFGQFCFNVLPFGINSGPEHFQRRMSQLLDGITGIICHADDVLVCGKDKTQHDERLTEVLFRLQKAGLTLNEKCSFAQSEVLFVGHRVSAEGIAPDPEKVRAIVEMTTPQNVADVRRFLGMATYMSKFIPHFTDDTKPLRDLLAKQNGWIWGSVQQAAFEKIKSDLASTQVLAQYKPEAKTKVSTDASSFGLGAVLSQMQNEKEWRPVAFISRSLSETEQRYAQVKRRL